MLRYSFSCLYTERSLWFVVVGAESFCRFSIFFFILILGIKVSFVNHCEFHSIVPASFSHIQLLFLWLHLVNQYYCVEVHDP